MDWTWLLIGLLAAMVLGIIWALLAYSAEEERRAAEAWRRAVPPPRRQERDVWGDDDAA